MVVLSPLDPQTVTAIQTSEVLLRKAPLVLLYVGPDQLLPLASVFGAIAGVVLMFWSWVVGIARKCWMAVTRRSPEGEPVE